VPVPPASGPIPVPPPAAPPPRAPRAVADDASGPMARPRTITEPQVPRTITEPSVPRTITEPSPAPSRTMTPTVVTAGAGSGPTRLAVAAMSSPSLSRPGVAVGEPPPRSGLVGRDAALAVLADVVQRAIDFSAPQLVTIVGHRGTGKTRLLTELDARLEASSWSELEFVHRNEWTLACNWKVYVDNYLDGGYHVPHMHPTLDAQLDMARYQTELFAEFSIQSCPSAGEAELAQQRIGGQAIYAWLFPNFMINRYGPCLDSNHVIPLGPDRCKVVCEFYFRETKTAEAKAFIAASIEQSAITQREDIEICESVQVGLRSGAYDRGRYAPRVEQGEHHFHQLLARALRRA